MGFAINILMLCLVPICLQVRRDLAKYVPVRKFHLFSELFMGLDALGFQAKINFSVEQIQLLTLFQYI